MLGGVLLGRNPIPFRPKDMLHRLRRSTRRFTFLQISDTCLRPGLHECVRVGIETVAQQRTEGQKSLHVKLVLQACQIGQVLFPTWLPTFFGHGKQPSAVPHCPKVESKLRLMQGGLIYGHRSIEANVAESTGCSPQVIVVGCRRGIVEKREHAI